MLNLNGVIQNSELTLIKMLSWHQRTKQGQRLINNNTKYTFIKKGGNTKSRDIAAKPVNS